MIVMLVIIALGVFALGLCVGYEWGRSDEALDPDGGMFTAFRYRPTPKDDDERRPG